MPAWKKFLEQFQDVLVVLLLIATAISAGLWLYERESAWPYEAIAICVVVLLNAVIGYIQESRAESAVAALRQMAAAHARVIRGGQQRAVPAAEVVPGDIVLIEEGDTIPADARVIQSTRSANCRGRADGRKRSRVEGFRRHRWRGGTWRSAQHDFQRHRGHVRAWPCSRRGHRNAHGDGPHRGHAARCFR